MAAKLLAVISLVITLAYIVDMTEISNDCLYCICKRNNGWARLGKNCTDGVCGPYYISRQYYIDAGSPGAGYEACTKEMECSETCVRNYMAKYGDSCSYPAKANCKDFCRMHWSQSRTGCRTQDLVLKESNIALAWEYVGSCCELTGFDC